MQPTYRLLHPLLTDAPSYTAHRHGPLEYHKRLYVRFRLLLYDPWPDRASIYQVHATTFPPCTYALALILSVLPMQHSHVHLQQVVVQRHPYHNAARLYPSWQDYCFLPASSFKLTMRLRTILSSVLSESMACTSSPVSTTAQTREARDNDLQSTPPAWPGTARSPGRPCQAHSRRPPRATARDASPRRNPTRSRHPGR